MLGGHLSCPPEDPFDKTGFTQSEFTINPTDSQEETVDISLVNGAYYALSINVPGDGWVYQHSGEKVHNGTIGPNGPFGTNLDPTGNDYSKKGIFPVGCTTCTSYGTPPDPNNIPCPSITPGYPSPTCQAVEDCNIKRDGVTGGTVEWVIGNKLY